MKLKHGQRAGDNDDVGWLASLSARLNQNQKLFVVGKAKGWGRAGRGKGK